MNQHDIVQIALLFAALITLSPAFGSYMASVFDDDGNNASKRWFASIESIIYRIAFINAREHMNWKQYAFSLGALSFMGFIFTFGLQYYQASLPLNPQQFANVEFFLALNTAISFVTNTNWQAYAGENSLSYATQMLGLTVQNFVSAATGIAVAIAFIRGITRTGTHSLGNLWVDVVRAILYILLPLSSLLAILLISQGVIQNFSSYVDVTTLEGAKQMLPMGPAASQIAIKQLGTNGGGFFGVNSAHPFENPTAFSNFLQLLAILLVPSSLLFTYGKMAQARRHAMVLYAVMATLFLVVLGISLWSEYLSNNAMGIGELLEGKELRFGRAQSILWSIATTATSSGSVNAMLDSIPPIAGGLALFQMLLGEIIFGGVGSGLYGMLLFVLLTTFLAGLMVGRTPEYRGKKIEAYEIQMVLIAIIAPGAMVLVGAGLSSILSTSLSSLNNHGPHGLTEIVFAFASAANNNGAAFAGLNANIPYYNVFLSLCMIVGRFGVMIPVLAIAGSLAAKKHVPLSASTFATDTPIFAFLLTSIMLIVGALTFLPTLALGPLVEHYLMVAGKLF